MNGYEQVKLIVERRWMDDDDTSCDPVAFTEAESEWLETDDVDVLRDHSLAVVVRALVEKTKVTDE